ncbi:MAG: DUF7133 domain-containing protein [Verrucomicrobiales bacterium]
MLAKYFSFLLLSCSTLSPLLSGAEAHGGQDNKPTSIKPSDYKRVNTPVIAGNTIPEGTSLKLFATHEEHGIKNPTAIAFDEKGALYLTQTPRFGKSVVDNRHHLYWLLDDIASTSTEDRRAMHEKWKHKLPLEKLTDFSDDVLKFTDTNGDGHADQHSVFATGFNDVLDGTGAGVFALDGRIYYACIPKIYILEDRNKDDKADTRKVVADGFGTRVSFSGHDLNGFALGNDGRIYSTIGDRSFNTTTREGKNYPFLDQGAIFRFDPDGSNFEVLHTGLRNPKEIAFDDFGNGISIDNNSDQGDQCRIIYLMEGGDSGWRAAHQNLFSFSEQIGLDHKPISRWMTEKMWQTRNSEQPAYLLPPVANMINGPSGLTYYPGSGFLPSEKGRFLICDFRGNPTSSGIWSFKLSHQGASLKLDDYYQLNWGVAPTDVEYSYDGRLFVADFITGWGGANQGQIYALTADSQPGKGLTPDVAQIMSEGFSHRSNDELLALLGHPNRNLRLRAHLALAAKADGTPTLLKATEAAKPLLQRLHGLWGLGVRARRAQDTAATSRLLALLSDSHPEVRGQAAQFLGEAKLDQPGKLLPLLEDPSPRVQAFAAIAIGRQKFPAAAPALIKLIAQNKDNDLYLRHAAMMGLLGAYTAEDFAKLTSHESSAVRSVAVVALRRLESPLLASFLNDPEPAVADEAIRAIHDRSIEAARPQVAALLDNYLGASKGRELKPMIARRLIHSAFRCGGTDNATRLIKAANSPQLETGQRLEALRLLSQWPDPFPVDQSLGKWAPLPQRELAPILPALTQELPALLENNDPALVKAALGMVQQLKLGSEAAPDAALRALITKSELPGDLRALALQLYTDRETEDLDQILVTLADDQSDTLAAKVLDLLVTRDHAKAALGIQSALKSDKVARRQAAWTTLGNLPGKEAAEIIVTGLQNIGQAERDSASQIELLEAAAKRSENEVKAALAAYEKSLDPATPLAAWLPALEGGDPAKGKDLFQNHGAAQCLRCHRVGDSDEPGILAGPNLAGIGKNHDRQYLLEALILPGQAVAPGYGVVSLTLKNGATIGGILIAEDDTHYEITAGEDTWSVKKSDVAEATPPASAMPPMSALISKREARDLVAYLSSLTEPLKNAPAPPQAKPLDPATLKK